jgi:cytochrome b561
MTKARNSTHAYGWVSRTFHWVMAALIIGMLAVGLYMEDMPLSPQKLQLYGWHKSVGIVILILAFLRLAWKFSNPPMQHLNKLPLWQRIAARSTHALLYISMLAMPLTGWLMSSAYGFSVSLFGWVTLPDLVLPQRETAKLFKELHEIGMIAFFALLTLHISGAFRHYFLRFKHHESNNKD